MASNSLYLAARRLFFLLQNTDGQLPVELLQAGILITLYECSHAIWNFAYLSLANCVALSRIAGLRPLDTDNSGNTFEKLMLLLNTDNPHPSLILEEPRHDITWPVALSDLPAFDNNSHDSAVLIKFYVTAQSAYRLGPALRYVSLRKGGFTTHPSFESIEASVTELTSKLLSVSQIQPLSLCDTTSFAVSVLGSLRTTHYLSEPQQMQVNLENAMSLHSVLNMAHEMVHTSTEMTSNARIGDMSFIGLASVLRATIDLVVVKGKDLDIKEWDEIEDLLLRFIQLLKEFTQHKQAAWPTHSDALPGVGRTNPASVN
ncbi:hypothetical protein EKO27_g7248 [Xylaria grammica]|uniref:Transcription factor domain-containing protein n=1 Tax=Xylaria grammica TaxID=363999 RepID=A0A439D0R6_9PEZI|nr:hypothetical protein EKO27_g7248 [Xylaria grammica]